MMNLGYSKRPITCALYNLPLKYFVFNNDKRVAPKRSRKKSCTLKDIAVDSEPVRLWLVDLSYNRVKKTLCWGCDFLERPFSSLAVLSQIRTDHYGDNFLIY